MKKVRIFLAGMLTAVLLGSTVVGALAASGNVVFNVSAIHFQGRQISAAGEDYALSSGQKVPSSITYVDANGGGTTYLPVRRFAELLGIEVSWDGASGSVTVGKEPTEPLPLHFVNVRLVKAGDSYYILDGIGGFPYYTTETSDGPLLFAQDINVVTSPDGRCRCEQWPFNFILHQTIYNEYDITSVDNPYLDGALSIFKLKDMFLTDYLTCGVEDTIYTSASESFTPMWVEYNGRRLEKQPKSDGLTVVNGVRYQDGMICMNDVLTYFGIDKTITVGEYQGLNYIEIK